MYSIFTKEMFVHTAGHLANKDCESCSKAPDPEALFGCSCKQRGDTSVKSWGSVGGGGGVYSLLIAHTHYRPRLSYPTILYTFKAIKAESKKDEFL